MKDARKWDEFHAQCKAEAKEKVKEKAKISATKTKPAVATTSMAKSASILKKGSQPFVRAAAEAINKAITFGAMSVKVALQGQHVSFNASLVGTSDKEDAGDGKEADKPEKGTPEELAQAKAASANAQFGHAAQKHVQESMSDKYPSLDKPVPKNQRPSSSL